MSDLSARLRAVVEALPLAPGLRVLEVGCGPGAAAREVARRVAPDGHVLAIDRSERAAAAATAAGRDLIAEGRLTVRCVAVEDLEPDPGDAPYDLAFAVRVGALDGRHPELEPAAHRRLIECLAPPHRLFVDGGDPLVEVHLDRTGQEPKR